MVAAAPGATVTLRSPAIEAVAASVAVMVCAPDFGIVAPYAVTVLPAASFAVTETLNPAPAVAVAGADRPRLVALASTVTATVVEREFAASETVIVCGPLVASVAENEPCPAFSVESG